ncbi:zonadhesin-like isoform X1 [Styela clava]
MNYVVYFLWTLLFALTSSQRNNPETTENEVKVEYICNNQKATLECNQDFHLLSIDHAYYGRMERNVCLQPKPDIILKFQTFQECMSYSSFNTIWKVCHGKRRCTLLASEDVFGNPCLNGNSYIFVKYRCALPGTSQFGSCKTGAWGSWANDDDPKGAGDFELFSNHRAEGVVECDKPSGMEVRLLNGDPYTLGEDVIKIEKNYGATCINQQQDDRVCNDYKIRYCCDSKCERPLPPTNGYMTSTETQTFSEGDRIQFACNSGYELEESSDFICLSSSEWSSNVPTCVEKDTNNIKYCFTTGFPHYTTFDGRNYKFGGTCSYTMAKSTRNVSIESFYVSIENSRILKSETWIRKVTIDIFGQQVEMQYGKRILVDKVVVRLPFEVENKFVIRTSGRFIELSTNFDMTVTYDGQGYVSLGLPDKYSGNTEGLCGNYNHSPEDDFAVQGGLVVLTETNTFGNHYLIPTTNPAKSCNSVDVMIESSCLDSNNLMQFEDECSVITNSDGPIAACYSVESETFHQNCLYDVCYHNGSNDASESSIAAYVENCQRRGIEINEWRSSLNKSCVCDKDNVQSDLECVPLSDCGCKFEGKYYKNREAQLSWQCTRRCECLNGVTFCNLHTCNESETCKRNILGQETCVKDFEDSAHVCRAWGSPHYTTFDGSGWYDFNGRCGYIMSASYTLPPNDPRWFLVSAKGGSRDQTQRILFLESVQVQLQDKALDIVMYKNGTITMNNDRVLEARTKLFTISRSGRSAIVSTPYGLEVSFTGQVMYIKLNESYKGQVRGLCGDYNGDPSDDLLLPSGSMASSHDQFVGGYQLGSCLSDHATSYVCSPERVDMWKSIDYCGALLNPDGQFSSCHQHVDPEMFTEKCLFDVCVTEGDKSVLSQVFEEYVDACKREGIDLCNWRSVTGISQLQCPSHSTYNGCSSSCQDTCFNPSASINCRNTTVEDCVCDAGYLLEGTRCVTPRECGCTKDGLYISNGDIIVNSDTNVECKCNGLDDISCYCLPGFLMQDDICEDVNECTGENTCHKDADCTNTVGSYYCTCKEGLVGDGAECIDVICPTPNVMENTRIYPEKESYRVGDRILYFCTMGYELNGFPWRVCESNGTWANKEPTCKEKVVCAQPDFIRNGRFTPERPAYLVGEAIAYSCYNNVDLKGDKIRTCLESGQWDGEDPTCRERCPTPNAPKNGLVISMSDGFVEDDIVEYQCDKGFQLTTIPFRTCLKNGSWAGPEPYCEEKLCDEPPSIDAGFHIPRNQDDWKIGDTIEYICSSGYGSPVMRVMTSECLESGKWSFEPPACLDIDECRTTICDMEGTTNYTKIRDCLRTVHDCHPDADCINSPGTFHCVCKLGYKGDGRENCSFSVPCPIPLSIENGEVEFWAEGTSAEAGEIIFFSCKNGYELEGDFVNTCRNNGKWLKRNPVCNDIDECASQPCHADAICVNTPGSYICFCREGFNGDGFNYCSGCRVEGCGCERNGMIYKNLELFWTKNCENQCICEAGGIRCADIPCDEDQTCVQDPIGSYYCQGKSGKCELRPHLIEVPYCFDKYNRTVQYNAGTCSYTECSSRQNTCCGIALEDNEILECKDAFYNDYTITVQKVARCQCQQCINSRTSFHGRAYGISDKGNYVPFSHGLIYHDGEFLTTTNVDGTFTIYFEAGLQEFLLRFEDNQKLFLTTMKILKFKKNGGSIFIDIQIPMISEELTENNSMNEWTINLEKASMSVNPVSFYKLSGQPYEGKVTYNAKYVNERGYEIETTPGTFYSRRGELMLFYDILYCMFRGQRDEALMHLKAVIYPSVNHISNRKDRDEDLSLWEWSSFFQQWDQREKLKKKSRNGKDLVCEYDFTESHNYLAIARAARKLCYVKVRGYKTNDFRIAEQIDDLIAKGIYKANNTWYTSVEDITTRSQGVCLPLPCDEDLFTAKFKVYINGNTTLNPEELKNIQGVYVNSEDNSINFDVDSTKENLRGPIYETKEECQLASIREDHHRFYIQSRYVKEFNTAPVEETNLLGTWYNTPFNWWSKPFDFTTCYIKIGIRGDRTRILAKSLVGQRLNMVGKLYGFREDISWGDRNMSAACIEVKCSGNLLDAIKDITFVDIEPKGSCKQSGINPKIKQMNQNVYITQRNEGSYRMYYPENVNGQQYGLYTHSSRDLFISKMTALRKCYAGNGGMSNVMIPSQGLGLVFDC